MHSTIHTKKAAGQQKGIISALDLPAAGDLIAAGSFSGTVGVYDMRSKRSQAVLAGHAGGVTHIQFSRYADDSRVDVLTALLSMHACNWNQMVHTCAHPVSCTSQSHARRSHPACIPAQHIHCACRCGNFVYSGARHDPNILCWDVRYTQECLYRLQGFQSHTAQRITFDIEPCGRLLFAGGADGNVCVYDLATGELATERAVAQDTVSCVSVHPSLPLLLTASGHRRFAGDFSSSDNDSSDSTKAVWPEEHTTSGGSSALQQPAKRQKVAWQPAPGCNELAVYVLEHQDMPMQSQEEFRDAEAATDAGTTAED